MQRSTTKMPDVAAEQLQLLPDRVRSRPVDIAHIPLLRSTTAALEYACTLASVVPKQVYPYMDYDKSAWSRICSGELDLDGREIHRFESVVGNHAYLFYLNHEAGFDLTTLRKTQDDQEKRIEELEREVADRDRSIRLLVDALKGKP